MRLSAFIASDIDAMVVRWAEFAATRLPATKYMSSLELRDHARQVLKADPQLLRVEHGTSRNPQRRLWVRSTVGSKVANRPGAVLAKGEETCLKADFAHQARWGAVQRSLIAAAAADKHHSLRLRKVEEAEWKLTAV